MRVVKLLGAVVVILAVWAVRSRGPALADTFERTETPTMNHGELALQVTTFPDAVEATRVLSALRYWTHQPEDVLLPWANAIADVAKSHEEAIWIASQASVESRFVDYVLDYSCNRKHMRVCDNSFAVGPWQFHDRKLIDESPDKHAVKAAQWMRAHPQAWTTWRSARAQADSWLAR